MGKSAQTSSPLEIVAETAAPATAEAFKELGNETRLAILLALWDAFEPFNEGAAVSFTDLRKRVGIRDGSQFHYHLDRLVGHFVRQTDDGYKLLPAGLAVIWAVIAGTGLKEPEYGPAELTEPCPYCDAETLLHYTDAHLVVACTECEGNGPFDETIPEGVLFFSTFAPTGLVNRTPDEILDVCSTKASHADLLLNEGVCPSCSGPVKSEVLVCADHDSPPGELCSTCTRRSRIITRHTCTLCKNGAQRPPKYAILWHPRVIVHCYHSITDQGSLDIGERTLFQLQREMSVQRQELVSMDPLRLRITIECAGDELDVLLDEEGVVIDARR